MARSGGSIQPWLLVHRPRLLFLDEPTVGADTQSRARILDVVRGLAAAGCTVVYTSHYLPEIESLAATVAVLDAGRIVARAPLEELVSRYGSSAIRLTFDGPAPALPGFSIEGATAFATTPEPAREAAAVFAVLGDDADRVLNVDIVRPSLEAAYLALTGRRSADDPMDIQAATVGGTLYRKELSDALVA